MLRLRVCAAHMGWFLSLKFSEQGFLFWQILHKHGWVIQKMAKITKMGHSQPKFIIKVGMTATAGN